MYRCPVCDVRFVPPVHWLTADQEVARYRLHRNRIDDAGYVRFLMPVIDCLKRHGVSGRVLDYGAGPGPVLLELLRRAGFEAQGYDPNFAARGACDAGGVRGAGPSGDATAAALFDAVVSTEVFEHFRTPQRELDCVAAMLRPGGLLVVMTALVTEDVDMTAWHYASDATHIVFYTEETFRYIAGRWGFKLVECAGNRLVALRRVGAGSVMTAPCGCGDSGQE